MRHSLYTNTKRRAHLLQNQTWILLPACRMASILTPGCDEGKCSSYFRYQARSSGSMHLSGLNSLKAFRERFLNTEWGTEVVERVISSWTFFWYVGCEIIRSQHHQPSGSNQSEVCVLVGNIQLTSFIWWGFQNLKHSSKVMAQNIIYSPWGGTKGSWLCQVAKLLLFSFAWLFSLFSCIFSFLWLNLLFGLREGLGD